MGGWGEVRQERLYSRLTSAQKRQKCKFVPRLLSMIADSRPSKLLSRWLVLSLLSASSSIRQVLHLVWCGLRALMKLKSPKKWKLFPQKSLVQKSRESKCISRITKKSKTSFPRTEKYRFTNQRKNNPHLRFTQSKNVPSRVTKKV